MQLTVFTSDPYTFGERQTFRETLARQLGRSVESLDIQLIEILTASNKLLAQLSGDQVLPEPIAPSTPPPLTVPQTQVKFLQTVNTALGELVLPTPAQLLRHEASTSAIIPLTLKIFYLSDRDIDRDAQTLLREDLRNRLSTPTAQIVLERVPTSPDQLTFDFDLSTLSSENQQKLNQVGQILQQQPELSVDIVARAESLESSVMNVNRFQAIKTVLAKKWQVDKNRINNRSGPELRRGERPKVFLKIIFKR